MPPRPSRLAPGLLRPLPRPCPSCRPFHAAAPRGGPPKKGRDSIFKEMFPDAGASIPAVERQRRQRDTPSREPTIRREVLDKDDLRAWLEAQSHGDEGAEALPEKDQMPAMLVLSNASKSLAESDFYRIGRKGEHLQAWNTTIKKVIHLYDRNTLAPLDSYFILFTSRAAARTYQREAERLYALARADAATQDSSVAPLPTDDPAFTLAAPSPAPLSLKLYALPPSTASRLGAFTLGKILPTEEGKPVEGSQRVIVSLQGGTLPTAAVWGLVRRDGEVRNLKWDVSEIKPYFAQKASSHGGKKREKKTAAKGGAGDGKTAAEEGVPPPPADETATEAEGADGADPLAQDRTHAKSGRFVMSFGDVHEARRFARSWHRREVALSPPKQGPDKGKGKPGQSVTFSVTVPW
ncbi:hypothetical protein ACHAQA_009958 [Verticillium albo-atrum]